MTPVITSVRLARRRLDVEGSSRRNCRSPNKVSAFDSAQLWPGCNT